MSALKKLWLLLFFLVWFCFSYSQNINWMLGTWKGTGNPRTAQFVKTLVIESVAGNNFIGSRSKEANDHNHSKIVTAITGEIGKDTFYIKDVAITFKKDPPHDKWFDCTQCIPFNKVTINGDSILLSSTTSNCHPLCNGVTTYFKLIPDFDTATQRLVVEMFGTPEQIVAFNSKPKNIPSIASSDPDAIKQDDPEVAKKQKQINDSLEYAAKVAQRKRQQEITDSLKNAAVIAKQQKQQYDDSIKIAKKRQQEIDDSLQNVALLKKQREKQIADSLENVANIAKQKRQKEIDDSITNAANIAKQKQQHYDDSIKIAKKRQQQIDDSLQNVALIKKQREKQIADSLQNVANIAQQKRQQEIDDSLKNVAIIAKQKQQQYDDSIKIAKKRQQQIDDSLQTVANIAKQKQQRYDDSVKFAKKRQQQIDDSLQNVALIKKQRQKQIDDSLQTVANIAKQKRQQQIDDSLKTAALIAKQKQQRYDDSIKVAKKRQQQIADSLHAIALIRKQRQKQIDDSLLNVANTAKQKRQQQIDDSLKTAMLKQQQVKDSLQKVADILRIRQQEIADSLKIAAGKKQPVTDTAKSVTAKAQVDKSKALVQRDNVLLQTYHITNPDILIELFDNAEIDGDKVSVFHNNQVIINNQMLTHEPIVYKVHADSSNRMHEFILVAENLGTIPPNTALMRVTADKQVYKLSVKTDLKTNAKIVFYYDGN